VEKVKETICPYSELKDRFFQNGKEAYLLLADLQEWG
jgi:hypothetical protein